MTDSIPPDRESPRVDAGSTGSATEPILASAEPTDPGPRARLFVAIELPENLTALVGSIQSRLRDDIGERASLLRWVDVTGAHLTLAFLGATPESRIDEIVDALDHVRHRGPVHLASGGLGAFPGPRSPRVLWIGLDGERDALGSLRSEVQNTLVPLGWPPDTRGFAPHVTIARARDDARSAERRAIGIAYGAIWPPSPVAFAVDAIALMRSDLGPGGPRYTRLARIPLTTAR
ncbi:MAG: RNA 2',3'-cyclic phosphodiesterase [Chloroflexota bacterium]|nr:MAG: RNA 2',3'-cyclic phosphodiesterase [Chloroflexota bacterium]